MTTHMFETDDHVANSANLKVYRILSRNAVVALLAQSPGRDGAQGCLAGDVSA
jgi:hypothetical protein